MILFHTFNVLSGTASLYLSDLIETYITVRMLQSESYSLLRVPRSHTALYGERSFRASAPRLWNKLPKHIKLAANKDIFCKVLKTLLFIILNQFIMFEMYLICMSSEYVLIVF